MVELETELVISDDPALLNIELIAEFLHQQSYWAEGIPKTVVIRSIENSLCFGAYLVGEQVGFARVITDKATFAYLADVFVVPAQRGRGIAKSLMRSVLAHADLQGLRRILLITRDAQSLYQQFGFTQTPAGNSLMHIHQPGLYQKKSVGLNR